MKHLMKIIVIIFLLIPFFYLSGKDNQNGSSNPLADLESVVLKGMSDFKVPGLAIGIIKDGKILLSRGYGYKDHKNKKNINIFKITKQGEENGF